MEDKRAAGGIGFLGMLAILFIGLKLVGAIDWSWWWVVSPLWLPVVLILVFIVICLAIDLIFGGNDKGGFDGRGF